MARRIPRLAAAVVLVSCAATAAAQDSGFTVSGFRIDGDNPLSTAQTEQVLAPFRGEHRDIAGLQAAAAALEAELHAAGWGFYKVVLPPQEIGDTVALKLLRSNLSTVAIEGAQHASQANVRRSLPALAEGSSPNLRALARDIGLANESQFRQLGVAVKAGAQPDTVEAGVAVQDRRPWSVLLSADNSGGREPARSRLSLAVQHADLFDSDHTATLSYTTSPEAWSDVEQYGAFYKAPVYGLGGSVSAYAFRSTVKSGVIGGLFSVSGSGRFTGLGYTQHLLPLAGWRPTLRLALDDRLFEDDTRFVDAPIGADVRSRPLTLELAARSDAGWGDAAFQLGYSTNLRGGGRNDDAAYAAVREGATRSWDAWRGAARARWLLPHGLSLVANASGQAASQPLIPGEQFGIGGQDSVRGLETRQVLGDSGLQGTLELQSPPLFGSLILAAFYDYGRVERERPAAGTPASEDAQSLGVGLRWQFEQRASVVLDYGHLIDGVTGSPRGHERLHLTVSARF